MQTAVAPTNDLYVRGVEKLANLLFCVISYSYNQKASTSVTLTLNFSMCRYVCEYQVNKLTSLENGFSS